MAKKINPSFIKSGMNKDAHGSQLQNQEFSHVKNGNFEAESGEFLIVKNEKSNILATKFKEGFKVIHAVNDIDTTNTYFFLVNPETGDGEFGVVENNQDVNDLEDLTVNCGDCESIKELADPLENLEQLELQTYTTLISDECLVNKAEGFNFDILRPIKKSVIKNEKCGKTIYFSQVGNPPRHINIDRIQDYFIQNVPCGDNVQLTCPDFDKMRVFKLFDIPELVPSAIELGGNLKMGVYEFLLAYCDSEGNEISEYYSLTTPISIFDENNKILSQPETADRTNFLIRLNVEGLDQNYTHYKVAVIQTADIENATRYFIEGIHTINDTSVVYATEHNKVETSIDNLARVQLKVEEAEGVATANNILYQYGITNKKELNLQPIVNLLGELAVKWQTHVASEDLYKDGVNISKFLGYNRDEVVPLGIKFLLIGGFETAVFPLIGRTSTAGDLEAVLNTNLDRASLEANLNDCNSTTRDKKWQIYNTATVDEDFCGGDYQTVEVTQESERICTIEPVATIPADSTTIDITEEFTDLKQYIEDNPSVFIPEITPYLEDEYPTEHCTPNFGDNCTTPLLASFFNYIDEVINEQQTFTEKLEADYIPSLPPRFCVNYTINSSGDKVRDTAFETEFNVCGQTIYSRDFTENNETCSYAEDIVNKVDPATIGQAYFHNYYGEVRANDLLRTTLSGSAGLKQIFTINSATTGSITLDIDGSLYTQAFIGSEIATAAAFVATHQAAIELQTGGALSNSSNTIQLEDALILADTFTVTGDFEVFYTTVGDFANKLHKNALFYRASKAGRDKLVLDISKQSSCSNSDSISIATSMRYTIYDNCTALNVLDSGIIDANTGLIKVLDVTTYPNNFYIAIDTPLQAFRTQVETCDTCGTFPQPDCTFDYANRLIVTCGCFSIFTRDIEYTSVVVTWDSITINKEETYTSTCTFEQPVIQACTAVPYKKGTFAYWESQETYADNTELFDSTQLTILQSDIPLSVKAKFEAVFATPEIGGGYTWKLDDNDKEVANFTCRGIRHFKFPDNSISPFMIDNMQVQFAPSIIFPLGVTIDENVINSFLDIALKNGLISAKDRESITAYEIVRGDTNFDRSIVASGLLYDMRTYIEKTDRILYPNYPYNTYSVDKFNNLDTTTVQPNFGDSNNNFTFHSPETDYNRPSLPTELSVQGYMYGVSKGYFDQVEEHPKWVLLTNKARALASTLATLEVSAEATIEAMMAFSNWNQLVGFTNTSFAGAWVATPVIAAFGAITAAVYKYGRYRYQWLKTFIDLGTPYNFAYYYYSEGFHNYLQLEQVEQHKVRGLNLAKYLKEGLGNTTNEVTADNLLINNLMRERSVLISTGEYELEHPLAYRNYDKESMTYLGENGESTIGKSAAVFKNIASPYVALKNYLPQQYGTLNSVRWLTTGYRGDLSNPTSGCLSIFGGDTFISRHTLKRKHPQFLVTAMQQADRTPFNYYAYNNIGKDPLFYVSHAIDKDFDGGGQIFPDIDDDFVMDNLTSKRNYHVPPSKFYLYYYGIPSFLCETRINTNFRYAETPYERQFYPQVGDLGDWTQEKNVSIKQPNWFFYNKAYSKSVTRFKNRTLFDNYDKDFDNCRTDFPNGILASLPDNSENNTYDPWLIYRPLDFFEFPTNYGKLIDVQGIENEAILTRFENTSILYNKVDYTNDDGQNPTRAFLGGTVAFQRRSASFYNAQLGFGGTQNTSSISCEFGHFHVDAKRGQVIQMQPSGQQMEEISSLINGKPSGMRNWFKEHLPFKILKHFKDVDVDNNYNGVGITMAWDSRYRRVFITKKDYVPKNPNITHENGQYFLGLTEVFLTDSQYFQDVSWTIVYSPVLGMWMSFYDFKPNYYVSHNSYFQSGVNQTEDDSEFGLWSHGLTNKSYQVFYGKKYSFDVEYPIKSEYKMRVLNNVKLWTEAKRYHNEYNWAMTPLLTFNKSLIHNNIVCSGYLNLIPQKNNFVGNKNYPKTNTDGTQDILITNKDNNEWSYDYFYNRVLNNVSNIPFINYDRNQIEKTVDNSIVKFSGKRVLDRLEGDFFLNRLQYDKDSRYSLNLRVTLNETDE